jgi:hypothetical protein
MDGRWLRFTLVGVQGLLTVLWMVFVAYQLRRSHAGWSALLDTNTLLTLVVLSTLVPLGVATTPEGPVNGRRLALVSGIAVAVALAAFATGYFASRAAS